MKDIDLLIKNEIEESQNLEYKQPSKNLEEDCNSLAVTISGFLNTDGGILIYGVTEKKVKKHHYPDEVKWSVTNKETLENLLKSRVIPWDEEIRIFSTFVKKTPESYLQSIYIGYQIISYEAYCRTTTPQKIPQSDFNQIWMKCNKEISKNKIKNRHGSHCI